LAAAKRERNRAEIAKYLDLYRGLGAPGGTPSQKALWVILAHHGSKEGATRAAGALWRRFVDVNELRATKAIEIADLIRPHVRNDAVRVATRLRGFLRRFFRDHHDIDLLVTRSMTPEALRKYLGGMEDHARELGLALFLNYCANEIATEEREAAAGADAEGKAKQRTDREVGADLDRLRLACAFAVHGTLPSKAKLALAHRQLLRAWAYAPLPAEPRTRDEEEAAPRAEAAPPAAAPANTEAKKASRGGGTIRPRNARNARKPVARKSSRR
jgi:hypothetical protein